METGDNKMTSVVDLILKRGSLLIKNIRIILI